MGSCTLCRRTEVDLKPILEDLEKSFKFKLIFNSGCEKASDYKERCYNDFDEICVVLRTLWDIHLLSDNEYHAIRNYFYIMMNEEIEKTIKLKGELNNGL